MKRVYFALAAGLTLAGCASTPGLDFLKAGPQTATLQFESEPSGAEAKASVGGSCRTPCSMPVTADTDFTVTFTLAGHQPQTVPVQMIPPQEPRLDPNARFEPNPVVAELELAPGRRGKAPAKKPRASAAKHAARAPAPAADSAEPAAPASPFPPPAH